MTKDKIYTAVVKTYRELGVEGLSMKTVAQNAGIGKSTIYEYFESKEMMLAETILVSAGKFIDGFYERSWNREDEPFEVMLKSSIDYLIYSMSNDFGDFIAFAMESANGRFKQYLKKEMTNELIALAAKAIGYTRQLVEKGQREGLLQEDFTDLDILNFQRLLVMLCSNFVKNADLIRVLANQVEDPVGYVYDHMVKLYKK